MRIFSSLFIKKASDKSRITTQASFKYRGLLVGLAIGLLYGVLEWWFDHFGKEASHVLWVIHESFDFILPLAIGALVGVGITLYQKNKTLNEALSTQNQNLRSRLLANTLLAHILHEIRNPIHNLSALLEKSIPHLPQSDREIAERNLKRLGDTAEHLKTMNGPWDEISARQHTFFSDWLHQFIIQSVKVSLTSTSIRYTEDIQPFRVYMHPLLLEQCFTILFQNAIQACSVKHTNAQIILTAKMDTTQNGYAIIEVQNTGSLFPAAVLDAAGKRAVRSSTGMGIGLLLARDTIENIGGTFEIFNTETHAMVRLKIPAERLL